MLLEPVGLSHDDVVPFGLVGPLAVIAAVAAGGGQPETGDRLAAGQVPEFGVPAEMPQKGRLVDGACHAPHARAAAAPAQAPASRVRYRWVSASPEPFRQSCPLRHIEGLLHDMRRLPPCLCVRV